MPRFIVRYKPRGTPENYPLSAMIVHGADRDHAKQRWKENMDSRTYIYVTVGSVPDTFDASEMIEI